MKMPKVSVVIPTHNRPEMLKRSVASVVAQTYSDWELIVVDDGLQERAQAIVASFGDERIRYIPHEKERGGSVARNTGIRAARSAFIAFQDDDDEWVPEKLEVQMKLFTNTSDDIGFCFSAVINVFDDHSERTHVPDGIDDYAELSLASSKNFLTVTLVFKRPVLDAIGYFDESLPSHQETDLIIRAAAKYKGLGIDQPLVMVNLRSGYERTGGKLERRIAGREMIIKKHRAALERYPEHLAFHYFRLGLFYRDNGNYQEARRRFRNAWRTNFVPRYFLHDMSMLGNGLLYRLIRKGV